MHKLDSQIKICPTCNGWSYIGSSEGAECKECPSFGVYIIEKDKLLSLNLPAFIDFGKRKKNELIKKLILFSLVFIIILITLILIFIVTRL